MATGDNGDKQPLVHKPGYHDDDEDSDHVISEDALRLRFLTTEELEANYWKMSAAFSVNHGCVNCCLAYASTVLGDRLGSIGNGLLYVVFALSAAFFSKPFVSWLGGKTSLVVSCFGYFIFVVGFLAAVLGKTTDDDTTAVEPIWGIYLIGCFCGGLSGGILWTAQGRYFAQSARLAASESGSAIEEKNNSFAATFALLYLGSEMVLKLIATLLYSISWGGVDSDIVVFGVYPVIAFISSVFMMLGTRDLQDNESMQTTVMGGCEQAVASFTLAFSDIRLALLLPFQVAFGFASSFFLYYIFGTIVSGSTKLGVSYIGLMSATIMFAGATTAFPAAYIANRYGKPVVMTGGGLALAAVGLTCFVFNTTILGTREMIIPIMIVFGVARGTWVSFCIFFFSKYLFHSFVFLVFRKIPTGRSLQISSLILLTRSHLLLRR